MSILAASAIGCGAVELPIQIENRDTNTRNVEIRAFERAERPRGPASDHPTPDPVFVERCVRLEPGDARAFTIGAPRGGRVEIHTDCLGPDFEWIRRRIASAETSEGLKLRILLDRRDGVVASSSSVIDVIEDGWQCVVCYLDRAWSLGKPHRLVLEFVHVSPENRLPSRIAATLVDRTGRQIACRRSDAEGGGYGTIGNSVEMIVFVPASEIGREDLSTVVLTIDGAEHRFAVK